MTSARQTVGNESSLIETIEFIPVRNLQVFARKCFSIEDVKVSSVETRIISLVEFLFIVSVVTLTA